MHATELSPALRQGLVQGLAMPTPDACKKLLPLAVEKQDWEDAAFLSLALHPALPADAQAGFDAALAGARQPLPASAIMPSATNSQHQGAAQLLNKLHEQVCVACLAQ